MRHFLLLALLALFSAVSLEAGIINVPQGGNLQSALDAARPGDEIVLQAGTTYTGPFTLRAKNGTGEIVIRSSALPELPAGVRVSPVKAGRMPQLVSASDVVIEIAAGAHDYRLAGLEIAPASGRFLTDLVRIGSGQERTVAEQPRNITIERSYLHGDAQVGTRRGVALNGVNNTVVDSYLSDFKATDVDSQGIAGWNGAGPYLIRNNYVEGSAENIMFGGWPPVIEGLIPSNIRIEGNHLRKPTSWKNRWMVKNLLELKNARGVLIDSNILEDTWPDAQAGYAVVITPRNSEHRSPWSAVEDVQFTNNTVRRATHGMLILGYDNLGPSGQTRRLTIRNNVFEEITGALFEMIDASRDVVIEHNTGLDAAVVLSASPAVPAGIHTGEVTTGFVFRNNLTVRDEGGILGFPKALAKYFPDAIVQDNAFVGGSAVNYPPNNVFPPSSAAATGYGQQQSGIQVGYAIVTPDAGSSVPLGSALVGRLQNGEVLSQTTVFAPALATSAAMFVDVVPAIGRNMGLALSNPNSVRISVTLRLINSNGAIAGAAKTVVLEPYTQVARFVDELFGSMPAAAFTGTLTMESTAPAALMGFRFGGPNFSVISIDNTSGASPIPVRSAPDGSVGGPASSIFPQFAMGDGWATQIMLLNRATAVASGRVDIFDAAGNPMAVTLNGVTNSTFRYVIPAGGTLLLAPRDGKGQSAL